MAGLVVENFGCRAARADGEALAGHLRALAEQEPLATDVVVVNTCSVTAEADRAARAFIRRAHRQNPAARIVVTGCYAQRAPQELAAMAGVAAVVGNSHKALAPAIIADLARGANRMTNPAPAVVPVASLLLAGGAGAVPVWADDRFAHSFIEDMHLDAAHRGEHQGRSAQTRPNMKIQEGCGNRCTFCVIPYTRGPSKSLPYAVILRQVEAFAGAGGKELVLSGINLGRWGRDLPSTRDAPRSLAGLARMIFSRTALLQLRLSSIEPMDWDDEMVALMREFGGSRLARHAHLPLQSGSDAVLRRMHRRYRPWHYAAKVAALAGAAGPDLTLGADVMAGFPGETDREFEQTLDFVRALPFGYLHLFPFSARPGTAGWALHAASPVPAHVVAERMAALRSLAADKTRIHRSRFIGSTLTAITLESPPEQIALGRSSALTDNFLPVDIASSLPANQMVQLQATGITPEGILQAVVIAQGLC